MSDAAAPENSGSGKDGRRPLKLILVGDTAVGKTKLAERFLQQGYCPRHESTHALTWFQYQHELKSGEKIPIDLWDTAGQERFNKMHTSYYHGAHAAILVFDIQRKPTYKSLQTWHAELRQMRPDVPTIVAANKIDLDPSVTEKQFAFATKNDLQLFYVSAADGTNVVAMFEKAIEDAIKYNDEVKDKDIVQEVYDLLGKDAEAEVEEDKRKAAEEAQAAKEAEEKKLLEEEEERKAKQEPEGKN